MKPRSKQRAMELGARELARNWGDKKPGSQQGTIYTQTLDSIPNVWPKAGLTLTPATPLP